MKSESVGREIHLLKVYFSMSKVVLKKCIYVYIQPQKPLQIFVTLQYTEILTEIASVIISC